MPEEITQQRVELHFSPLCSPERTMSSALRFSHPAARSEERRVGKECDLVC